MMKSRLLGLFVTLSYFISSSAINAQDKTNFTGCPSDIETLTELMLKDLPSYTNRVIQRERLRDRPFPPSLYVLVAGKPEFEPLPLTNLQYQPVLPDTAQQVFFTTLERQYGEREVSDLQNYYWLFLTPTEDGWRSVLLFSQLASLNEGDLPLP
ncbi:MAG TPA: hypothetical protein DCF68_11650, partial [Cyanothece sp. UBA12306]|nr:hypothetical protein [Cyanothece sp. UBA12306]